MSEPSLVDSLEEIALGSVAVTNAALAQAGGEALSVEQWRAIVVLGEAEDGVRISGVARRIRRHLAGNKPHVAAARPAWPRGVRSRPSRFSSDDRSPHRRRAVAAACSACRSASAVGGDRRVSRDHERRCANRRVVGGRVSQSTQDSAGRQPREFQRIAEHQGKLTEEPSLCRALVKGSYAPVDAHRRTPRLTDGAE